MPEEKTQEPRTVQLRTITIDDLFPEHGIRDKVVRFNVSKIIGDIRDDPIRQLEREMLGCLDSDFNTRNYDPYSNYCVDFKNIRFYSADALGKLVTFDKKHLEIRGRYLALADMQPDLLGILKFCTLDRHFEIYDTVQDYIEARKQELAQQQPTGYVPPPSQPANS